MIMTSSPLLHPHPNPHQHSSPSLRPSSSSAFPKSISPMPSPSSSPKPIPRSYARAPPQRPYAISPLNSPSSSSSYLQQARTDAEQGDTKRFAELVAGMVHARRNAARTGHIEDAAAADEAGSKDARQGRRARSLAGSLAGSWEEDRAELIVDLPVWSPGCFQDLSSLHALRESTLSHVHALLAQLHKYHSLPASYRLLTRSPAAPARPGGPTPPGWGCIRLAPSSCSLTTSPTTPCLRIRRSSATVPQRPGVGRRSSSWARVAEKLASHEDAVIDLEEVELDGDDVATIELKEGYLSGVNSDDEEDESRGVMGKGADWFVSREVEKRKCKEGSAFLMTLHGQPALILT